MQIGKRIQKLVAPLLIVVLISACSTSDTLTPPADIGSNVESSRDLATSTPTQQATSADNQYPTAPVTTAEATQQPETGNSPLLGAPGGISAANRSIFQSPTGQAAATGGSIRFLPVIGAPVSAVAPLSQQLATSARTSGLILKGASDATADHMLKGYFSAFADGGNTTVVYVWDVLNASGVRLHRIQGQEKTSGAAADNWSAVPAQTMQKIAADTIAAYNAWRQNAGG